MKKEINKIGILSMFKIYLLIGLVFGLFVGGIYGLIFAIGGVGMLGFIGGDDAAMGGVMMIVIAIVIVIAFTILDGLMMGICGAIGALVYNIAAKVVGGIELELEDKT